VAQTFRERASAGPLTAALQWTESGRLERQGPEERVLNRLDHRAGAPDGSLRSTTRLAVLVHHLLSIDRLSSIERRAGPFTASVHKRFAGNGPAERVAVPAVAWLGASTDHWRFNFPCWRAARGDCST